jgi:hypothetical protein
MSTRFALDFWTFGAHYNAAAAMSCNLETYRSIARTNATRMSSESTNIPHFMLAGFENMMLLWKGLIRMLSTMMGSIL